MLLLTNFLSFKEVFVYKVKDLRVGDIIVFKGVNLIPKRKYKHLTGIELMYKGQKTIFEHPHIIEIKESYRIGLSYFGELNIIWIYPKMDSIIGKGSLCKIYRQT